MRVLITPWAARAMSSEALAIARQLRLDIVASSPSGPFALRHPKLVRREGYNVDALVLAAARELSDAD